MSLCVPLLLADYLPLCFNGRHTRIQTQTSRRAYCSTFTTDSIHQLIIFLQAIAMNTLSPWLVSLAILKGVAGFTFNTSVPTQCEDFTIQW